MNCPKKARERLGNICMRCGATEGLHVHHIKPSTNGGSNEANNLILFCRKCHAFWHEKLGDFWD